LNPPLLPKEPEELEPANEGRPNVPLVVGLRKLPLGVVTPLERPREPLAGVSLFRRPKKLLEPEEGLPPPNRLPPGLLEPELEGPPNAPLPAGARPKLPELPLPPKVEPLDFRLPKEPPLAAPPPKELPPEERAPPKELPLDLRLLRCAFRGEPPIRSVAASATPPKSR
jgi:hypothetical protein